jgi:16S rRNA (uracil1498-N3)-methyltransferase
MRLHRFFIEEQLRNKKEITILESELIHQLKNVFRLNAGDRLILLDNSGFEYISEIILLSKSKAEIKIVDSSVSENLLDKEREVWLFASLIKKDNFEWIIEKTTELGISHIVPIVSARTEKKELNIERAHKILKEASEQSGRGIMPMLHDIRNLDDAITHAQEQSVHLIAFHLEGEHFNKEKILNRQSTLEKSLNIPQEKKNIGILIGPEGGWSDNEITLFKSKNIPIYSLGKQVLRAETAAIVICGLILL